ncbi:MULTISPECIES: hypothetical protein [unclassified Roseovarius]|uniref:hypothetical protein n=1 Tax=unclassified Roseovarius TaxID=2614913 RepID=UPI00273DD74B|nr:MULTISPECIES: hypothetical protein [unclassified Roseovarius]
MKHDNAPFFVGYLNPPRKLRLFLLAAGIMLVAAMTLFGLLLGSAQDDPGTGAFRFDYGRQNVTGVIEMLPYPILHVTEGTERIKAGNVLMLASQGKRGVMGLTQPFSGQQVTASGILLNRGALEMLQLRGGNQGLKAAEGTADIPAAEPLGRWKLAGEICDGKCLAGAMRPGRGLAHKACANLCLIGDIPPVFVSSQPVAGSEFLMAVGPDGGKIPDSIYDYVGNFVALEGDITRHGDLLVLRMDPATIEVLP